MMRLAPYYALALTACGILAPGDGVSFEWSAIRTPTNTGVEFEVVGIERGADTVTIRGTFALSSPCYVLELGHAVVTDVLELRLTQRKTKNTCLSALWMAEYTVTISHVDIARSFTVTHDYGSTERLALEGSL